jgi:hypothetical protein
MEKKSNHLKYDSIFDFSAHFLFNTLEILKDKKPPNSKGKDKLVLRGPNGFITKESIYKVIENEIEIPRFLARNKTNSDSPLWHHIVDAFSIFYSKAGYISKRKNLWRITTWGRDAYAKAKGNRKDFYKTELLRSAINSPRKYYKEDLIWEAVRRNNEYCKFYEKAQRGGIIEDRMPSFSGDESNRWDIEEAFAIDPNKHVDRIKDKIDRGINPESIHPYYFIHKIGIRKNRTVIELDIPNYRFITNDDITDDNWTMISDELRSFLNKVVRYKDKMVFIAVDPETNKKTLTDKINTIIANSKKSSRQKRSPQDDSISERLIDLNLEYLTLYDKVISFINNEMKNEKISDPIKYKKTGIIEIPKAFFSFKAFAQIIGDSGKSKDPLNDPERGRKNISNRYNNAINLIRNAPNIKFKPAKS